MKEWFRVLDNLAKRSPPDLGYSTSSDPPQGEICVRGERVFTGYFNDPDLNEQAFVTLGGERYYRTGDQCRFVTPGCGNSMFLRRIGGEQV